MITHDLNFDVIMIGAGPGNLALAAMLDETSPAIAARSVMLEACETIAWQPGLMVPGALSQVNYVKDLATLRDPKSRFTFLNYLHSTGQIDDFINMGSAFPLREEVSRYHAWVADLLTNVRLKLGQRVTQVAPIREGHRITGWRVETEARLSLTARHVVIGIGREARIPQELMDLPDDRIIHSTAFMQRIGRFAPEAIRSVAIIGSAQSAAEMTLEIGRRFPDAKRTMIMRSIGLMGYETSKFTNEYFYPDFIDSFNALPGEDRALVLEQMHRANYAGLAPHTVEALYAQRYQRKLDGRGDLEIRPLTWIRHAMVDDAAVTMRLHSKLDGPSEARFDLVLLGTGFDPQMPRLILETARAAGVDEVIIDRFYRLELGAQGSESAMCFVLGVNEGTHGIADSLLSVQSVRAQEVGALIQRNSLRRCAADQRVKRFDPKMLVHENGLRAQRLLPFPLTTPFESSWCILAPGSASTPHAHHEYEIFVALEGEAVIEMDGEEVTLTRGDTVYFEPGARHRVVNRGTTDFIMYSIWWDDAMSLRQLAASMLPERNVAS
ncbi:MAG: SidA/IucD/PvdA family monooxygenase [Aestuariivirga sp.]|uniref:SidA/IucD/PvdA family monooxygenase n=1 Tax=Aestuariivirga sp. TaxID=2650926 RepID=UPI0025C1E32F|nr:SidA/IucD/PvdA family monooxygenase [Aestuariivirga sp.]MCA3560001.1 SidA/IucD/PvdA family monooxygenase [Aestuariivirga sp.]